jgi:hypothetical protein
MKQHLWKPASNADVPSQAVQPACRRLNKQFVRNISKHTRGQVAGNFKCPSCNQFFLLSYGVFGKMKTFEDPQFYCRDCCKAAGFVRM